MSNILISCFHPAAESGEDLEAILVGKQRKKLIEEIINELIIEYKEKFLQSHLIHGRTGIGKTFILCLIFHRIKKNKKLNNLYFPILLQEELFSANSAGDIISEALQTIIRHTSRTIPDKKIEEFVKEKIDWLEETKDKKKKFDRGMSILEEINERFKKKTIIMVENLDRLFPVFQKNNELNNFLKILPRSSSIKIIGTALTFLDTLGKREGPVYGYFRTHELNHLNEGEIFELISRIIEYYSAKSDKFLKYFQSPDGKRRVKVYQAISFLSGDLPRMVFPLFEIAMAECSRNLDSRDSDKRIETTLHLMQEMFEKLTLIYREMLWNLPQKERELLETFAGEEKALRPINIQERTGYNLKEISTYISRLLKKGYLLSSTEINKKKQYYILSDPLLAIWYKWRKGASEEQKWSFVIDLLANLFEKEELGKIKESEKLPGLMKKFYTAAYNKVIEFSEKDIIDLKLNKIQSDVENIVNKGTKLGKSGIYEEALKMFEKALEIKPDHAGALNNKGVALLKSGKYEEALKMFEKAIKIKSDLADAWINKGYTLGQLNRHEEELKAYEKAIELEPDSADAWCNMGVTLGKSGKNKEALKAYEKAIELEPDSADAWYNIGVTLGKSGKNEEALNSFEKAININPNFLDALYNKGMALIKLKKYKKALEAFNKVIALEQDNAEVWYNMGFIRGKLGKYKEALDSLEKAIAIKPDYAEAWYNKGVTHGKSGKYKEALSAYEKAIQFFENKLEILSPISKIYNDELDNVLIKEAENHEKTYPFLLLFSISIYFHLKNKNIGIINERINKIIKWEIESIKKTEAVSLILFILLTDNSFNEIKILREIFQERKWKEVLEKNQPIFIANEIIIDLKNNKPTNALEKYQKLDAVNRKFANKMIETRIGKNWLKEAREKSRK